MYLFIGVACLIVMCASILVFASFPISQFNRRHCTKMNLEKNAKDYYSGLFDVYDETSNQ